MRSYAWILVPWLWLSAAGLTVLTVYAHKPGAAPAPPAAWPADSAIPREPGMPVLVMLVHTECPCSRASVAELARLVARRSGRVTAGVLFVRPHRVRGASEDSDLWRSAAAIPGVMVISDVGGVEASRFHAMTSGATLLFSARGELLFSGGITPARGHEGDSAGQDAILSLLDGELDAGVTTPVYGCPLGERTPAREERQ